MKIIKDNLNKKNKIITLIFLIIVYAISSLTFIQISVDLIYDLNHKESLSVSEQKFLSKWNPVASNDPGSRISNMIKNTENIVDDYIFKKSKFAQFDTNLNYFITGNINSTQVLIGKDRWLFYKTKDGCDPIADYQGTNSFTSEELILIINNLVYQKNKLKENNIDLYIMILPNKEHIYHQYMPYDIQKINDNSRTDILVNSLKENTTIPIIYPKEELLKYAPEYQLYYKYDTHWNQLGAFIAEQQFLSLLSYRREYLEDQVILCNTLEKHPSAYGDLANIVGMEWYFNDEKEYQTKNSFLIKYNNEQKADYIYNNNNAKFKKTILFVGDSFRIAIIPHIVNDFSEVHIIHQNNYNDEILKEVKPDIVILEYVERFSSELSKIKLLK